MQILSHIGTFNPIYLNERDQLRQNCVLQNFSLRVDLDHLAVFDRKLDLASKIKENPTELIPLVCFYLIWSDTKFSRAAREVASNLLRSKEFKDGNQDDTDASSQEIDDIQIILDSSQNTVPIRSLVVRPRSEYYLSQ